MKISITITVSLILLSMVSGFCFGMNYQQHREYGRYTEHLGRIESRYEQRIEELSKRHQALVDYLWTEKDRIERDYMEYKWLGNQYWRQFIIK